MTDHQVSCTGFCTLKHNRSEVQSSSSSFLIQSIIVVFSASTPDFCVYVCKCAFPVIKFFSQKSLSLSLTHSIATQRRSRKKKKKNEFNRVAKKNISFSLPHFVSFHNSSFPFFSFSLYSFSYLEEENLFRKSTKKEEEAAQKAVFHIQTTTTTT